MGNDPDDAGDDEFKFKKFGDYIKEMKKEGYNSKDILNYIYVIEKYIDSFV